MKRILGLLLLVVMCLSLAACGGEPELVECSTCYGDGIRECYMITRYRAGQAGPHSDYCSVCGGLDIMVCNGCNGSGYVYK